VILKRKSWGWLILTKATGANNELIVDKLIGDYIDETFM